MNRRSLPAFLSVAALVAGVLGLTAAPPGTAAADTESLAVSRLHADASGGLTYRSSGGVYDFAGVPARVTLDDPAVSSSTSVGDAAAAHLARYGAAFGSKQAGTTLTELRSNATVTGDVVRYQQNVGGLPVMGGEFVVSLRPNRELDSILAKTSRATTVSSAKVSQADATATAQEFFQGSAGEGAPATIVSVGRWVVDPTLIGASKVLPTRTVWRFELSRGAAERRMVLVDDQLGAVLMNVDLINEAKNRVVCDNANVPHSTAVADAPCVNSSPNLVRTELSVPAALAEANTAFDLGGVVHDNYAAFQTGFDLTNFIGRVVDGGSTKALAQTVRWCYTGFTCPYANAFWNGSQMYYGATYATADDVVGHEMTHGVTERTSGLFYWSQSGAMNESLSDIMGEIIDHRNVQPPGEPVTWTMGEDLPIGAIRNVQNPPAFNDPDRTGSPLYVKEACCGYPDEDGVHTNSGVGNKTFYLASQGGTFNSQTITGIDTGDATLTKSAKLWLLTDQSLSSGSDYADEAAVLDQSCQALIGSGVMNAADCTAVHQATLATELTTTPVNNPQPTDATVSCPTGTPQVLFDSETGTPGTKFNAGPGWSRSGVPGWGQIAHSNPDAWSSYEATPSSTNSLTAAAPVALPAGQSAYLFFQHWRLLQGNGTTVFNDAGTVEINGADAAALPWVNGPAQTIGGTGNPANGKLGFGGDSRGYVASRVDLSSFAGTSVTPQFSFNNNNSGQTFLGWWVDDIQVYTCAVPPPPTPKVVAGAPTISGKALVGKKLTAHPGSWTPGDATLTYQWLRNGVPIAGATGSTYKLKNKDKGKKISVTVTGTKAGFTSASATSPPTKKVKKKKPHHREAVRAARLG